MKGSKQFLKNMGMLWGGIAIVIVLSYLFGPGPPVETATPPQP